MHMIYDKNTPEPQAGIDTVWDADGEPWYRNEREIKGWHVEDGNVYPWAHALSYGPLDDRKSGENPKSAMLAALNSTDRLRGPLYVRADEMIAVLNARGWRLIHE